jgi:hypothetical protein
MPDNTFHIIISPSGLYLWWTLAPTEDESWEMLKESYPDIRQAKRKGCRCVRVRLVEEGK